MDLNSGTIYAHINGHQGSGEYGSKVIYDNYSFNNLIGAPAAGLTYSYDGLPIPTGAYTKNTNVGYILFTLFVLFRKNGEICIAIFKSNGLNLLTPLNKNKEND